MWIPAESHSEINSWRAKSSRRRGWDIGFVISQCQGPAARCHETNGSVYPSTRLQIWAKKPKKPKIPHPPPPQRYFKCELKLGSITHCTWKCFLNTMIFTILMLSVPNRSSFSYFFTLHAGFRNKNA